VPIIEAENITKSYDTGGVVTEVLQGLSFSIEKGEFISIIGRSGSGKSTLLHILGFLADHTSGTYKFNGKKFTEYSDDEVATIRNEEMGFVFQSFNLLGRSTVYENVLLPLLYSEKPESKWDEDIRKSIDHVGLTHRIDFQASRLSGGERQRVAIARALVNDPKVIFADEPTGNLDSGSGETVMKMLESLNRDQGRNVILITHDKKVA
jgi:putative ABC transport system ATP-binding protein